MTKILIKPHSKRSDGKWIPEGMISFLDGPNLTERKESYDKITFETQEEADQYFVQVSKKIYKVKD